MTGNQKARAVRPWLGGDLVGLGHEGGDFFPAGVGEDEFAGLEAGEPALVPGEFEVASGVGGGLLAGADEKGFDVARAHGLGLVFGLDEASEGGDFFGEGGVLGGGEDLLGGEAGEAVADGSGGFGEDGRVFLEGDASEGAFFAGLIRGGGICFGAVEATFAEEGGVGDAVGLDEFDELGEGIGVEDGVQVEAWGLDVESDIHVATKIL
jgi:hypothetical protein